MLIEGIKINGHLNCELNLNVFTCTFFTIISKVIKNESKKKMYFSMDKWVQVFFFLLQQGFDLILFSQESVLRLFL